MEMVSVLHLALPTCSRHLTDSAGLFQNRILAVWGSGGKLIFMPGSHPEVRINVYL